MMKTNKEIGEENRNMCEALKEIFAEEFARLEELYEERRRRDARRNLEFLKENIRIILILAEALWELGIDRETTLATIVDKFGLEKESSHEGIEEVKN